MANNYEQEMGKVGQIGDERFAGVGSDAPIRSDFDGWTWRNPLNVFPLSVVVVLAFALIRILA